MECTDENDSFTIDVKMECENIVINDNEGVNEGESDVENEKADQEVQFDSPNEEAKEMCYRTKNTVWGYKLYAEWASARELLTDKDREMGPVPIDLATADPSRSNYWLSKFILEVRRKSDNCEFPPKSLTTIMYALSRFYRGIKPELRFADPNNSSFKGFHQILKAEIKRLKTKGKRKDEFITFQDEVIMWGTGTFNTHSARGLSFIVYFYNGKLFKVKTGSEHYTLTADQFQFVKSSCGQNEFLRFSSKCETVLDEDSSFIRVEPRVIDYYAEPCNAHCIVKVYKKYLNIIPNDGVFYRSPIFEKNDGKIQFSNEPIGRSNILSYMDRIYHHAGIPVNANKIFNGQDDTYYRGSYVIVTGDKKGGRYCVIPLRNGKPTTYMAMNKVTSPEKDRCTSTVTDFKVNKVSEEFGSDSNTEQTELMNDDATRADLFGNSQMPTKYWSEQHFDMDTGRAAASLGDTVSKVIVGELMRKNENSKNHDTADVKIKDEEFNIREHVEPGTIVVTVSRPSSNMAAQNDNTVEYNQYCVKSEPDDELSTSGVTTFEDSRVDHLASQPQSNYSVTTTPVTFDVSSYSPWHGLPGEPHLSIANSKANNQSNLASCAYQNYAQCRSAFVPTRPQQLSYGTPSFEQFSSSNMYIHYPSETDIASKTVSHVKSKVSTNKTESCADNLLTGVPPLLYSLQAATPRYLSPEDPWMSTAKSTAYTGNPYPSATVSRPGNVDAIGLPPPPLQRQYYAPRLPSPKSSPSATVATSSANMPSQIPTTPFLHYGARHPMPRTSFVPSPYQTLSHPSPKPVSTTHSVQSDNEGSQSYNTCFQPPSYLNMTDDSHCLTVEVPDSIQRVVLRKRSSRGRIVIHI